MPVLPVRDGVGASHVQVPAGPASTLIGFLVARFPAVGETTWRERFARGLVQDGAGHALAPDTAARRGQDLYYWRELPSEPDVPLDAVVLHRDEHLVVADKPHFLPVVPSGRFVRHCLLARLRETLDLPDLAPLHRIDRGTAGVVLFSCNRARRAAYQSLFPRHEITKQYEALADWREDLREPCVRSSRIERGEPFFRMREIAGPPNSQTHIEMAAQRGTDALYRLSPLTGRKHQLRVHLAALGAPIRNDPLYPVLLDPLPPDDPARPLKLLARAIGFTDPLSGRPRRFESTRAL